MKDNKFYSVVIKWLNIKFSDLSMCRSDEHPESIFYIKDDEVFFEYKKNGTTYISYEKIWERLEYIFSMEYPVIQEVTKLWLEENYQLKIDLTYTEFASRFPWRNIKINCL